MSKVQVVDPPRCCSTGVCGPEIDPALVRFAAELEWLKVPEPPCGAQALVALATARAVDASGG